MAWKLNCFINRNEYKLELNKNSEYKQNEQQYTPVPVETQRRAINLKPFDNENYVTFSDHPH